MNKLTNTKTLTSKLAFFFIGLTLTIALLTCGIFIATLQYSEDLVAERRLLLDKQVAISQFLQSKNEYIKIDYLTEAYNNLTLIDDDIRAFIVNKKPFVDEIFFDADSKTILLSHYQHQGKKIPLVLITKAQEIEIKPLDLFYAVILLSLLTGALLFILSRLLYKLSTKLISPINSLINQLEQAKGDPNYQFVISENAATEFQQLTSELNHYRTEMNRLIQRERSFARYTSHELRTPLTIAKGSNELLSITQLDDYQHKQITRGNKAIMQMNSIVNALLSLVKIEREKTKITAKKFTTKSLKEIINNNRQQADNKDITISIHVISEPILKAEFAIMEMLIGNMIRNAIAATEKGKIEVILTSEYLKILDLGSGLINNKNPTGHGLGLLIIHDICQRYQWKFTLKNRDVQGCMAQIIFKN